MKTFTSIALVSAASAVTTVKWETSSLPKLPFPVSDQSATFHNGKIYLVGGCDQNQINIGNSTFICPSVTEKCSIFDPVAASFSACANAPNKRYRHAAAAVGNKIWLVGGRDGDDNITTSIDVYDPDTDMWSTPTTWPGATSDLAAFAGNDDDLFVAGGYTSAYLAQSKVYKIDTAKTLTDGALSISDSTDLNQGRGDIAAVVVGAKAYITGGWHHDSWCDPLESVEKFDIAGETWSEVADLGVGRADKALVALNGKLYAIGGEHSDNCTVVARAVDDVEVYDPATDTWTVESNIPEERFRFVAAAVPSLNSIYIFGGQKYYDATCDCYPVADDVLQFQEEEVEQSFAFPAASASFGALSAVVMALFA